MNVPWRKTSGWLVVSLLAGAPLTLRGEEPARRTAAPIIFSSPQSDTVSSNLNEISLKTSPLRNLESDLKKPFEVFQSGNAGTFRPPTKFSTPPAPVLNSRKLKELMDKRAEDLYLGSESAATDDFTKSDDELDPFKKKIKSPLESYYDRMDRQAAATNQTARTDDLLAGGKEDPDSADNLGLGRLRNPLESPALANSQNPRPVLGGGRPSSSYSENLKPRSFGDIFGLSPSEPADRFSRSKETRLDNFKRLLDGPSAAPRTDFTAPAAVTGAAPKPGTGGSTAPPPAWTTPQPAPATDTFDKRAGLVGSPAKPQGLTEFAVSFPSLSTPPAVPPAKPPPPPTFKVPKRQF